MTSGMGEENFKKEQLVLGLKVETMLSIFKEEIGRQMTYG